MAGRLARRRTGAAARGDVSGAPRRHQLGGQRARLRRRRVDGRVAGGGLDARRRRPAVCRVRVSAVNMDARPVTLTPGFLAGLADTARGGGGRDSGRAHQRSRDADFRDRRPVWPATDAVGVRRAAAARASAIRIPWSISSTRAPGTSSVRRCPVCAFNITHAVHPILGLDFAFGGTPELNTGRQPGLVGAHRAVSPERPPGNP